MRREEKRVELDLELRCSVQDPMRHLWAAVFDRGVRDFATSWFRGDKESEPKIWFWSDERHPGSFAWLCEVFDIRVQEARNRVIKNVRDLCDREELRRKTNECDNDSSRSPFHPRTLENVGDGLSR